MLSTHIICHRTLFYQNIVISESHSETNVFVHTYVLERGNQIVKYISRFGFLLCDGIFIVCTNEICPSTNYKKLNYFDDGHVILNIICDTTNIKHWTNDLGQIQY